MPPASVAAVPPGPAAAALLARVARLHHAEPRPAANTLGRGGRGCAPRSATATPPSPAAPGRGRGRAIGALLDGLTEAAAPAAAGVGCRVAVVLVSPPAGVPGDPTAAADAGVHPRQEQPGQRSASRLGGQGYPALRRCPCLAALAAIPSTPISGPGPIGSSAAASRPRARPARSCMRRCAG